MSNFYPILENDLSDYSMADIKKYIKGGDVKIDPVSDEILRVGNKKPNDIITWEDFINSRGSLRSQLVDYLDYVGIEGINIKEIGFDQKKKLEKIMPLDQELASYKDFWDYQITKLLNDKKDAPEKEKISRDINVEDQLEEFDISEDLISFYRENNKETEFFEWIKNIPSNTKITPDLILFFRLLSDIVENKEGKDIKISGIIKIKNLKVKTLSKNEQNIWKKDMIEHIASISIPDEINPVYEDKVLKPGEFLNALFMLDAQGVGRGELLMTYLIPGARFPGGGESYDLLITNNTTYEIKDYSNVEKEGKGALDSIRLGTGGKLTRFEFWKNLEKSISVAKNISNNTDEKVLKEILDPYLYTLWQHFISDENYTKNSKAISSAVSAGEVSDERLKLIKIWFYLVHELVERDIEDEQSDDYTMAILRGPNTKPKTVSISPIKDEQIKGGASISIESGKEGQRILDELSTLKYVKNPEQFQEDMNDVAKEYFNHNEDIDYFLVFRPEKINIIGEDGFAFAKITQASVKIIEKEYIKDNDKAKKAYNKWKDAINNASKKASKDEKESYKEIKRNISYKDFFQTEYLKESFYPRLFK